MFIGIIGLGVVFGAIAAGYSLVGGLSLFAALTVYVGTGVLLTLLTAAVVSLRQDDATDFRGQSQAI
jgi:hypothetical protein